MLVNLLALKIAHLLVTPFVIRVKYNISLVIETRCALFIAGTYSHSVNDTLYLYFGIYKIPSIKLGNQNFRWSLKQYTKIYY